MKKEIPALPFNYSQGMIMLASSIYSVALSFIVQEYVSSPAVNSLVNNISVAVSVAFALAIGSFVDQHGAWRILFFTTLLSGIACLLPPLIFDLDKASLLSSILSFPSSVSSTTPPEPSISSARRTGRPSPWCSRGSAR